MVGGTLEYELLRLLLHHVARGLHVLGAEVGLSLHKLDRAYLNREPQQEHHMTPHETHGTTHDCRCYCWPNGGCFSKGSRARPSTVPCHRRQWGAPTEYRRHPAAPNDRATARSGRVSGRIDHRTCSGASTVRFSLCGGGGGGGDLHTGPLRKRVPCSSAGSSPSTSSS